MFPWQTNKILIVIDRKARFHKTSEKYAILFRKCQYIRPDLAGGAGDTLTFVLGSLNACALFLKYIFLYFCFYHERAIYSRIY